MQQGTAIHDKVSLVQKWLSYLRELHLEIWDIIAVFQKEPSFFLIFCHPPNEAVFSLKESDSNSESHKKHYQTVPTTCESNFLTKNPKDRHIDMQAGIAGENTYGSNMINKITQEKVHQRTHARTYFPQQGFFTSNFQEIYMFKYK